MKEILRLREKEENQHVLLRKQLLIYRINNLLRRVKLDKLMYVNMFQIHDEINYVTVSLIADEDEEIPPLLMFSYILEDEKDEINDERILFDIEGVLEEQLKLLNAVSKAKEILDERNIKPS